MTRFLRGLVSGTKRRYTEDGFDLDLAFIDVGEDFKGRLLAMAYPSEGLAAFYRNDYKDVKRFLQHQASVKGGTYKVFNLTLEQKEYTAEKLGGTLSANFQFADHEVPTLEMMRHFCMDVDLFLAQDPNNFAAVHCKAGKGRTGVMICAYLLFKGLASNPEQAMNLYGEQRSTVSAGLTVPSQRRYVRYFAASLADDQIPASNPLTLQTVMLSGLKEKELRNMTISISMRMPGLEDIQQLAIISGRKSDVPAKASLNAEASGLIFTPLPSSGNTSGAIDELRIDGDVRIEVYSGKVCPRRLVCRAWMNTAFLSSGPYKLQSNELDKGYRAVPDGLELELQFGEAQRRQLSCTLSSTVSELESLPVGSPRAGWSPRSPLGTVLRSIRTSQEVSRSTSHSHILEIHPDFSIPASYYTTPNAGQVNVKGEGDLLANNPFLAAVEEIPQTPQESELSFALDEGELSARLESLAESQSKMPSASTPTGEDVSPFESPASVLSSVDNRTSLDAPMPIGFSTKFKRVHFPRFQRDDPERYETSAPTTPSLPRHPSSFDWQTAPSLTIAPSMLDLSSVALHKSMMTTSDSANLLFSDGIVTPSHSAQMIKWMYSSWWLSMV